MIPFSTLLPRNSRSLSRIVRGLLAELLRLLQANGCANVLFVVRQIKTDLSHSLLGCDTGTTEILGDITIEPTPDFTDGFDTKRPTAFTSDDEYKCPSSVRVEEGGKVV